MDIPIQGPTGQTFAIPINTKWQLSSWTLHWYYNKDLSLPLEGIIPFLIEVADEETCKLLSKNKDKAKQVTLEFFQWLGKDTTNFLHWYHLI
jgi:hypothetical protein